MNNHKRKALAGKTVRCSAWLGGIAKRKHLLLGLLCIMLILDFACYQFWGVSVVYGKLLTIHVNVVTTFDSGGSTNKPSGERSR